MFKIYKDNVLNKKIENCHCSEDSYKYNINVKYMLHILKVDLEAIDFNDFVCCCILL